MISNPKFQVEWNATVPKLCCPIVYLFSFLVLSMFKNIMGILEILSVASSEYTRQNTTTPNISRQKTERLSKLFAFEMQQCRSKEFSNIRHESIPNLPDTQNRKSRNVNVRKIRSTKTSAITRFTEH